MEIKEFEIEFVQRTKELLLCYKDQDTYDMSIIINCTLGLIILPYESIKGSAPSFWDTELVNIANLPPFKLEFFEPIKRKNKSGIIHHPKTLAILLQKIRNGLAHQHIKAVNDNGKFIGIVVKNYFPNEKGTLDLEAHFSQKELKNFALFIAEEYLKNNTSEKARNLREN